MEAGLSSHVLNSQNASLQTAVEYISRLRHWIMTSSNTTGLMQRESDLIVAIEKMLPDFARACHAEDIPVVVLHQDAFAADYQDEEYRLMGMAIKFAGIYGKDVSIHGKNRETVNQASSIN
jgi:hypothetical protein